MKDSTSNAGTVCPECMSIRKQNTQLMIERIDLASLIGSWVKKAFADSNDQVEHMWVRVTSVNESGVIGVLDQDPILCDNLKDGDVVKVKASEIEEVHYG